MVQSVKHLILDFGSGHGLTVCGFEPQVGHRDYLIKKEKAIGAPEWFSQLSI